MTDLLSRMPSDWPDLLPFLTRQEREETDRLLVGISPSGAIPFCPHSPHPKQAEFLALECLEALYGGAAGGGKSDALLMAALQWVQRSNYKALLLRRTLTELNLPGALMERARRWLLGSGATWREMTKTWRFPSGATLTFGYVETERDLGRYQGAEFDFIGFDELTSFPESYYTFLFSRLRRSAGSDIPSRMRGATNPGDIGHEWVMARFEPHLPPEQRSLGPDRVFVPARIDDNPSLDRDAYIVSLDKLDPVKRAQLLSGDWLIRPSVGFFKREWFRVHSAPPGNLRWIRFWDTASKATQRSDFWAGALCALTDRRELWIADVVRGRWEYADGRAVILQTAAVDGREVPVGIEDTSSGQAILSDFQRDRAAGLYSWWPVKVTLDLPTRAGPWASLAQGGGVHLLAGSWVGPFLSECEGFPQKEVHDDQIAAVSGAYEMLVQHGALTAGGAMLEERWREEPEGVIFNPTVF